MRFKKINAPGFVNYKKNSFDAQPQVRNSTSCLRIRGLLFQCAGTEKIQPIVFVWNKADLIIISSH
jgi:hypothetical protein